MTHEETLILKAAITKSTNAVLYRFVILIFIVFAISSYIRYEWSYNHSTREQLIKEKQELIILQNTVDIKKNQIWIDSVQCVIDSDLRTSLNE